MNTKHLCNYELPLMSEEFRNLVELFFWLKTIRDKNTRVDTLEPNKLLISTDNDVEHFIA